MKGYQKEIATGMVMLFGLAVFLISAATTFTFFAAFFSGIFPQHMMGGFAELVAGIAGVTLFDLAALYWLNSFLRHAETSEQRGIALALLVVTFVGGAGASVAQLVLSASGEVAVNPALRQTVADAAVWMVILGVVANFGAVIGYSRFSLEAKHAVRAADRRDKIAEAEYEQELLLDTLVIRQTKARLTAEADGLAQETTARLVSAFRTREGSRNGLLPAMTKEDAVKEPAETGRRFHGGVPGFSRDQAVGGVRPQFQAARIRNAPRNSDANS